MSSFPSLASVSVCALAGPQPPACAADCREACFNDAIVSLAGQGVGIVEDNCAGCGACIPACEFGFIGLHEGIARIRIPAARQGTQPVQPLGNGFPPGAIPKSTLE